MELQIYSPSQDGFVKEISWNHEEIKKEVAEKVSFYADLVYTDDQIKNAKEDRAKLRKFVDALETKRKEIKKQCLAPYEAFEKQLKEVIEIVNKPILMIDGQVKDYEDTLKAEKKEAIEAYWRSLLEENKIPSGITFNQLFDEKWLNLSVSLKNVVKEFNAKLEQIEKDLATLATMPGVSFEAVEIYKDTLDINKAITEAQKLSEMQKRKEEAAKMATAPATATATATAEAIDNTNAPEKRWIGFQALLSNEDALALRNFLQSHGIAYKKI